jgi:hypothetical protein
MGRLLRVAAGRCGGVAVATPPASLPPSTVSAAATSAAVTATWLAAPPGALFRALLAPLSSMPDLPVKMIVSPSSRI